jgi:hypothetical protein
MSWAEQRRANRAAEAEQARLDADAASARRIRERDALAEQNRRDTAARDEQARQDRDKRRATRAARWAAVREWAKTNRVELLIYPLAVASAVMAVPSMARYGMEVYGNATGAVLPVLSELGMWAFAFAVAMRRHRHPDASVWMLLVGVWTFAGIGFGINLMHGLDRGLSHGVVMGIASIAGVVAHQLVTAAPPRSRADRQAARIARRQANKIERIRRAAVRHAVAEIDADGRARLVYTPGRYTLDRRRLTEAIVPGLPVEPAPPLAEQVAGEVSAWLATQDRPGPSTVDGGEDGTEDRGPVATLDRGDDQRKSRRKRRPIPARPARSIEALRSELRERIAADPVSIDPTSAESIRRALRCSPARARQLRDEHREDA